MKTKTIIMLILVLLMLFFNVTSAFANEEIQNNTDVIEIEAQNTNDMFDANLIEVDNSNYNGFIKPASDLFDLGTGIYQDDEFVSYYFYNLRDNFGYNTHGSCGYVAAAMMLSYYDTLLNDNIIDGRYDVMGTLASLDLEYTHSSPGIVRETDSLSPSGVLRGLDCGTYKTVIDNNYLDYFQLYLIKKAEDQYNMYHDTVAVLEECGIRWETNSQYPCASAMLHQKSVIEYYLWNLRGLEGQVSLQYENTNVREFAISKIKDGQPVMLFLGSTSGCHFVVAYDLDDKGTEDTADDDIYAHYGYEIIMDKHGRIKDAMHINIDTDDLPWLISAMAFNFTMEHSHSYNYEDGEGNQYCSCYFPSYPNHVHEYEPCNGVESIYHTYKCGCSVINNSYVSAHNFEYTNITDNGHQEVCTDCGYERTFVLHIFRDLIATEGEHTYRCMSCDYTITQPHIWEYTSTGDDAHTQTCTDCGYTETQSHNLQYSNITSTHHTYGCAECGYSGQRRHRKLYRVQLQHG